MPNNEVLIKVEGLSKKFSKNLKSSLWYGVKDIFAAITGNTKERILRKNEFWALQDINFELRRGECLGLIGHNGAGKSTLLKILNGLINPDAGKVTIKGRVGALIELGAGFNPILTGRENIYNNGAILGFTKQEIDIKVEEIIDFAEIREFIDMPVQNYSSGMRVRLGFAVAAQMEPDVLLIDEVLAVGDIGFRVKCLNKISELLTTCAVIIVSHSMPQVARISTIAMLLQKGKKDYISDDVSKTILKYNLKFKIGERITKQNQGLILNSFKLNDDFLKPNSNFSMNYADELKLEFELKSDLNHNSEIGVRIAFMDIDQRICAEIREENILITPNYNYVKFQINELILANGVYAMNFEIFEMIGKVKAKIFRYEKNYLRISVMNVKPSLAPVVFKNDYVDE